MRETLSFFGVLLFMVFAAGVWLGVPMLLGWLSQLVYAAHARITGMPKPEGGYRLEPENSTVLSCYFAFAVWSVWLFMFVKRRHQAVFDWIALVDVFVR